MPDDLEIGIAAGLDVPTAIVLSEEPQNNQPRKSGCAPILILLGCLLGICLAALH